MSPEPKWQQKVSQLGLDSIEPGLCSLYDNCYQGHQDTEVTGRGKGQILTPITVTGPLVTAH